MVSGEKQRTYMRVECGELRVERKNEEHKIMNEIRLGVADECVTFRANVGKGYTKDGRYFDTGLPVGFSDLFGVRKSDGRAVFIEVKTAKGKVSENQKNFINAMQENNAIAGVCRSVDDAKNLLKGE